MKTQNQQQTQLKALKPTTNHQLWTTFTMEEAMKQNLTTTFRSIFFKKAWLILVTLAALLFSACSQQPQPKDSLDTQGLNNWDFNDNRVNFNPVSAYHLGLDVTTDNSGNPMVAIAKDGLLVRRWSSSSGWSDMGSKLNTGGTNVNAFGGISMTSYDGKPIIAYIEDIFPTKKLYVKRWNGSSWVHYGAGAALNANQVATDWASAPSLAVDSLGNPAVAWQEIGTTENRIYVKRWNGSAWEMLSGHAGIAHATSPNIAVGSDGRPVIAYLKCVSGGDKSCTNEDIYVARHERIEIKPGLFSTIWRTIGQTLETSAPSNLTLGIYNTTPVVAWLEGGYALVKRYDQSCSLCAFSWKDLGKGGAGYTGSFSMKVNSSGEPIIAYSICANFEFCLTYNIYVFRVISKTNWQIVGTAPLDMVLANDVRYPVLSVKGKTYIVAWVEPTSSFTQSNIYLKQYSTFSFVNPF
jgi:hypothetical protein